MRTTHLFGWAMAIVLTAAAARGQTEAFDPKGEHVEAPRIVRVMAEFVDVPHKELTKLLADPKVSGNDREMRQKVQQLVETGKAKVVETMVCASPSGHKATTESIHEFIYPTEYAPSHVPARTTKSADGKQTQRLDPDNATGPTPTAFDTRNLGSTLEIEPTASSDSKVVSLRLVPEIVYHVNDRVWAEWFGNLGDSSVKMPQFYTMRLNTTVTVAAGHTMLVGTLSPKDADGMPDPKRKVMVFVRCDVLEIGR